MAKFCVYCGKPLNDGEVCGCRSRQNAAQQPADGDKETPAGDITEKVFAVPDGAQAPAPAVSYFKNMWRYIAGAFKMPVPVLGSFAAAGDMKTAFGLISIYSLKNSLFVITVFSRMNSAISGMLKSVPYIGAYLSQSRLETAISFPIGRIFLVSFVTAFGLACLFGALLLLAGKGFCSFSVSYGNTLAVAAAAATAALPFIIIGIICALISVKAGIFVALLSVLPKILFTELSSEGIFADRNRGLYTVLSSLIIFALCLCLVLYLTRSVYVPDGFSDIAGIVNKVKTAASQGSMSGLF